MLLKKSLIKLRIRLGFIYNLSRVIIVAFLEYNEGYIKVKLKLTIFYERTYKYEFFHLRIHFCLNCVKYKGNTDYSVVSAT